MGSAIIPTPLEGNASQGSRETELLTADDTKRFNTHISILGGYHYEEEHHCEEPDEVHG